MSKIKRFFRRKSLLRNIILGILVVVTVGAAVGGVVALTRNADKIEAELSYTSVGWTKYRVGGLDGQGNFDGTQEAIYTKDAFECQGLNVDLDFDAEVSYEIFFYNQDNIFVHKTGRLTGSFVEADVPFIAKYARIVVTPDDDSNVMWHEVLFCISLRLLATSFWLGRARCKPFLGIV